MKPHILILAAGQGKRMQSALPKVLHPVLYQPMLHHVLQMAQAIPHESISVVVGHGEKDVRAACESYSDVEFFRQATQRGTADAVLAAKEKLQKAKGLVLVLCGDMILLRTETLQALLEKHAKEEAACTVLCTKVPDPTGYGRILRASDGSVTAIREHRDCSDAERAVDEINSGIYVFDAPMLMEALGNISNNNKQGEYYLTDAIEYFVKQKKRVASHIAKEFVEGIGINDRIQLADAERILQWRINADWQLKGVSIQDRDNVWISPGCEFGKDIVVESGCRIIRSHIGAGTRIEANCRIVETHVGDDCYIKQGSYLTESKVGNHCAIGPYAHFRPKSVLSDNAKIGNFVEIKNSIMGEGSKANHLSYIGDAEVGNNVNLGCGFITCNYDGVKKHKTTIEDDVFVGSDSQTVAPVTIGKGAYIAAGTTVTKNVPPGALAISRGKQNHKEGYTKKKK